ncbi:MAG: rRNA (cytosine1962-C5)-methyltransferase, partial [Pyrinomonadaceae bacterium]|nr:rRNA (cytosine1962-C5)-methyltransferase [Pyrinomonadaceae bacterium]
MKTTTVIVSRKGAERARAGHLWIYRSDLLDGSGDAAPGASVHVRDERGRFVGCALYSDRSQIALRLLSWREETIDRDWWRERLRASIARRAGLEQEADAFRLVY